MSMINSRPVKSGSRFAALGILVCLLLCGALPDRALADAADSVVTFDIPAQALGTALNSVAVQANLQIFFEQAPVAGLQAPAISGAMTVKQALQTLLANTQLRYTQNADGTLVVGPRAATASRAHARKAAPVAETAPAAAPPPEASPAPQTSREADGPWMVRARGIYVQPYNKSDPFAIPASPSSIVPADAARTNDGWSGDLDAEYFFSSHWSGELAVSFPQLHELELRSPAQGGGSGNVGSFRLMPNFLTLKYNFLPDDVFRPYLGAGINVTAIYGVNAAPFGLSKTTGGPAAQAGFDIRLSGHWYLNADVKWAHARPAIDFDGDSIGHMKLDPVLYGLGIGYRFGGSPAPAVIPVAAAPAPPPAPMDSDGDGVPDTLDQCPNTPRGVQVDAKGCPLDSDGDGVPDYLDKCPGTPAGLKVDANGCEIEEMVLTGVNFETDSATLTPQSWEALDKVVAVLRQRPGAKAEIHGYTDSRGSDSYNQKLSERRAAAVVDYFIEHGISGADLSSKGFGKSNPLAGNDTAEGRAQNRRVTVAFSRPVPR